ncbi:MAG: O-antigen ligase family protein [Acidobacteriota bacterium]|nr:O-antigen ligase family protein [Acidobacteriota bacterium]
MTQTADVREYIQTVARELPEAKLALAASVCFSLCVLTFLISIAASQIFFALAGVLYFAHLLWANPKPRIDFPPVKLPLAFFCGWTVISVLFAGYPDAGGFAIRKLTLFLILLFTVNLIVTGRHLVFLFKALFVEAAVAGIVGAAQFIKQYEWVRATHPGHIYMYMTITRITGFQGHWMNFGGQQMLVFTAMLAFLLLSARKREATEQQPDAGGKRRRWFAVWWVILAIVFISILLNLTRGVWLGCFVGAIYVLARWRAKWLWALPVLVAISILAAPRMLRRREESVLHPRRDTSLAERFEMWGVGWRMILKHPLVGVGPDNIPAVYDLYMPPGKTPIVGYHDHLHNNFVQYAAERGLPCLAAWIWLVVALLWRCVKVRRRAANLRWVADAAIAAWIAMIVEGTFEFSFGSSLVLMLFLFVIAAPFVREQSSAETMPASALSPEK